MMTPNKYPHATACRGMHVSFLISPPTHTEHLKSCQTIPSSYLRTAFSRQSLNVLHACSPTPSISGLVAEYIVAIDVNRVRFPADAILLCEHRSKTPNSHANKFGCLGECIFCVVPINQSNRRPVLTLREASAHPARQQQTKI